MTDTTGKTDKQDKQDKQMEIILHDILNKLDGLTVRQVNTLLANIQRALLDVSVVNPPKVEDVSYDPLFRFGRNG